MAHYSSYLFSSFVHSLHCPSARIGGCESDECATHTPDYRRFIIHNSKSPLYAINSVFSQYGSVNVRLTWRRSARNGTRVVLCHCSDSLAFATEPVLGSLANLLGAVERLPLSCQQELKVGLDLSLRLQMRLC